MRAALPTARPARPRAATQAGPLPKRLLVRRRTAAAPPRAEAQEPSNPAAAAALADLLAPAASPATITAAAAALAALGDPGPPPPSPSTWRTLFNDAKGPSSGRFGPFQGSVSQTFHADGGSYTNTLSFGPLLTFSLSGTWEAVRPDRVNVVFVETAWSALGGLLSRRKKIPEGKRPQGHWSLLYGDDSVRVFRTNRGSVFVLIRDE